jgi:acid stress chaperone HdeB
MFGNTCKKAAMAALLSLTLVPARAAPVDMATLTCEDWIDASDDEQDQMIAWLRGYLAGRSSVTLYDARSARGDRDALMVACRRNPTIGVISAMSQSLH